MRAQFERFIVLTFELLPPWSNGGCGLFKGNKLVKEIRSVDFTN